MVRILAVHRTLPFLTSPRINTKLLSSELEPMTDLVKDLSDGVKLIQLLVRPISSDGRCIHLIISLLQEIMSGTPLGRYNPRPKMRVQKAEVCGMASSSNLGAYTEINGHHRRMPRRPWISSVART